MSNQLAKTLKVVNEPGSIRLEINGEEFPFYTADGYRVAVSRTGVSGVTLTIVAQSVEVIDHIWVDSNTTPIDHADDELVTSELAINDSPLPALVRHVPPNRSALNDIEVA